MLTRHRSQIEKSVATIVTRYAARASVLMFGLAFLCLGIMTKPAVACPFCTAVAQTFSEEMQSMDIVLFAELTEVPEEDEEDMSGELPRCKFQVTEVLNGDAWYAEGDTIEVHYFGPSSEGGTFLIMGTDPPDTMWGTPLIVSQRVQDYLKVLPTLPTGHERLEFFIDYLEDEDELLARDAYDEFAKTPYDGVIALKDSMDHGVLVGFIENPDTPPSRRRLYLTMLGVCGSKDDCEMLESMMRSACFLLRFRNISTKRGFQML